MPQNLGKKICLVVDSLATGGAEKVAANLSVSLINLGYEVVIISLQNKVSYTYAGAFIGLNYTSSGSFWFRVKMMLRFFKTLKQVEADYYIDFRYRSGKLIEFCLLAFVLPLAKTIYTVHSNTISFHKPNGVLFTWLYKKLYRVVAVSKAINESLKKDYGFSNSVLVYNFFDYSNVNLKTKSKGQLVADLPGEGKYIVILARLIPLKQIDKLILAYKDSVLVTNNISLLILGEGSERDKLQRLIDEMNLNRLIQLVGFVKEPYTILRNALFTVLCSREEGLPMAILESLACGTPVVSFDCKSGPSEMIAHEKNGLLVADQDFNALKEALNIFVENQDLYHFCKQHTAVTLNRFSEHSVLDNWKKILV